jgi:hypothetical protein
VFISRGSKNGLKLGTRTTLSTALHGLCGFQAECFKPRQEFTHWLATKLHRSQFVLLQRVRYFVVYKRQRFPAVSYGLALPLSPSPLPRRQVVFLGLPSIELTGGRGGRAGAKSYDGEKCFTLCIVGLYECIFLTIEAHVVSDQDLYCIRCS